jgi:hypothetical protein
MIDQITTHARKSSLNLRMANFRRMLDKMVPKSTTAISCEVSAKDQRRFYDFIRTNQIPIAIRVDRAGVCEAVVIEENKGNDCRKYTHENTRNYYVLKVGQHYGDLNLWIRRTFDYEYAWTIDERMTFGYMLESEQNRI